MTTQIAQLEPILQKRSGRRGQEHLAAVAGGRDARGPVHIPTDIPLVGEQGLSRVHSHPHPNRPGGQRRLRFGRCRQRVGGPAERNEERVPFCPDLDPPVSSHGRTNHAPMLGQDVRIALGAQRGQQSRRAFDVRDQEGHGPGREFAHAPRMAEATGVAKRPVR